MTETTGRKIKRWVFLGRPYKLGAEIVSDLYAKGDRALASDIDNRLKSYVTDAEGNKVPQEISGTIE